MALTEAEEILKGFLALSKARTGAAAASLVMPKTEQQQVEMCEFPSQNEAATEKEILETARRIAGM